MNEKSFKYLVAIIAVGFSQWITNKTHKGFSQN
jgi:hypothetical protein